MTLTEEKGNLFELSEDEWVFAHCISCDAHMGKGIAVEFAKRFPNIKQLRTNWKQNSTGSCIYIPPVMNLITKKRYYKKPNYQSIESSINKMAWLCRDQSIEKLAMPKIGCGLDRLSWGLVREIIKNQFQNLDVEIKVRYL